VRARGPPLLQGLVDHDALPQFRFPAEFCLPSPSHPLPAFLEELFAWWPLEFMHAFASRPPQPQSYQANCTYPWHSDTRLTRPDHGITQYDERVADMQGTPQTQSGTGTGTRGPCLSMAGRRSSHESPTPPVSGAPKASRSPRRLVSVRRTCGAGKTNQNRHTRYWRI
jgi:hypothetical protein